MERDEQGERVAAADENYARGRLDEALEQYREALGTQPELAWAWSRIGAILAQTGHLDEAERHLTRAIELDAQLPQAHSNLGNIFYARGDYQSALEKYQEAVRLSPSTAVFHENLHAAYKKLGKLGEAVSALKQAHRVDREQSKQDAKAKIEQVRKTARGRFGCLSLLALVMGIFVITLLT